MTVDPGAHNHDIDPTYPGDLLQTNLDSTYGDLLLNREWTPDLPPQIAENVAARIVPVRPTPSDNITFMTVKLDANNAGNKAYQLVGKQPLGTGCRVKVRLIDFGSTDLGNVCLTSDQNVLTLTDTVNNMAYVSNGYILLNSVTLELETRDALYAVFALTIPDVVNDYAYLSVSIETYEL